MESIMKKIKCDVLVIGGGPAGGVSAVTAKTNYPNKEILVVREFEIQLVPCAIPYIFGETLGCSEKDVASCGVASDMGISTLIGEVEDIDTKEKLAYMKDCQISFDKLIFATGSEPFVHSSLQHSLELDGVFTVPKNKTLIDKLKDYSDSKENIVVVGSGFIGIEIAVEFATKNKNVTVIGGSKHILKRCCSQAGNDQVDLNLTLRMAVLGCTKDQLSVRRNLFLQEGQGLADIHQGQICPGGEVHDQS